MSRRRERTSYADGCNGRLASFVDSAIYDGMPASIAFSSAHFPMSTQHKLCERFNTDCAHFPDGVWILAVLVEFLVACEILVLRASSDEILLCVFLCSLPTRPSRSRRSWPRRLARTGKSPSGSALGPTTRLGAFLAVCYIFCFYVPSFFGAVIFTTVRTVSPPSKVLSVQLKERRATLSDAGHSIRAWERRDNGLRRLPKVVKSRHVGMKRLNLGAHVMLTNCEEIRMYAWRLFVFGFRF